MATPSQWISGARPRTLPAAFSPVIAGTGVAAWSHGFVWWAALLALVVAVALQIGVNYANDYSDGIRGTDDDRVGPFRLTGSGATAPRNVRTAAFVCFGAGAVVGLVLAATAGWWLLLVGLVCVAAAWYYTGGRHPYGYAGLGEVMVFLFFGVVAVMGTAYVQVGDWSAWGPSLLAAVGVGSMACAILVANNLRDIPTDAETGKNTLAVRLGDRRTRILYAVLVVAATAAVIGLAATTDKAALLGLVFLGIAGPAVRAVLTQGVTGRALIPVLARTGQAELVWAILTAVPIALIS